ncbi:MAG: hypothetical protein P4L51_04070 [Puia sp.]|nr:hypothetical protein [Puia sp.]
MQHRKRRTRSQAGPGCVAATKYGERIVLTAANSAPVRGIKTLPTKVRGRNTLERPAVRSGYEKMVSRNGSLCQGKRLVRTFGAARVRGTQPCLIDARVLKRVRRRLAKIRRESRNRIPASQYTATNL